MTCVSSDGTCSNLQWSYYIPLSGLREIYKRSMKLIKLIKNGHQIQNERIVHNLFLNSVCYTVDVLKERYLSVIICQVQTVLLKN